MNNKKLETLGYEMKKNIISRKFISKINNDIQSIMESYLGKSKTDNSFYLKKPLLNLKLLEVIYIKVLAN